MATLIRRAVNAFVFMAFAACYRGTGIDACEQQSDPINREECRYDELSKLLADPAAFDAALEKISDVEGRDLALFRFAVDEVKAKRPERAQALCRRVQTPNMRQKCTSIDGRPHLSGPPKP